MQFLVDLTFSRYCFFLGNFLIPFPSSWTRRFDGKTAHESIRLLSTTHHAAPAQRYGHIYSVFLLSLDNRIISSKTLLYKDVDLHTFTFCPSSNTVGTVLKRLVGRDLADGAACAGSSF